MKRNFVENSVNDPVKYFTCRYPRLLVIRAAFKLLKDGKSLSQKDMEGLIQKMLKKR